MSGRSAHVRKEKTKVKQTDHGIASDGGTSEKAPSIFGSPSIISDFPMPVGSSYQMNLHQGSTHNTANDYSTIKTTGSGGSNPTDDLAYARVRKPVIPVLDVSGIEKSSFRSMMDKKSEGVRKGLAKTFGKKKKVEEIRPATAATVRPSSPELYSEEYAHQPLSMGNLNRVHQNQFPERQERQDHMGGGPPQGRLPPIPQGPQLKQWKGSGRPPQPWNKLRKDPELWITHGDTYVYFSHASHHESRPPPSFRLLSTLLEQHDSRYLLTLLQEGLIDDDSSFSIPPSPMDHVDSPSSRNTHSVQRYNRNPTPPMSENSAHDGQISYEIYFPPPNNQSKVDILRHQVTTRNVFALLQGASLVGFNLYQALNDLQERLEVYMPPDHDSCGMIIDYLISRGLDDVRSNPSSAASILAWSESPGVRWGEGWREAYVHCVGMYNQLEACPDWKFVTPITKAIMERASLQVQMRVSSVEERLSDFDFGDMWPKMSSHPPPARSAFERLQTFFLQFYKSTTESWPPRPARGSDQWLDRNLTKSLQADFGALYDYLVNREVVWDCSEERSGRKWNLVHPGNRSFEADTPDLPFTDILVAFDNRHKYPHIPHPYPLTPESMSMTNPSAKNKHSRPADLRMAERRAALAYTESTNIYLLGSDLVPNQLVDAFVRFEKNDRGGDVDPFAARRGRWVLIYGILQSLASISVDTPGIRYKEGVSYHLNPGLQGTPPWRGANRNVEEANHTGSYCWTIREKWAAASEENEELDDLPRVKGSYLKSQNNLSAPPSVVGSDTSGGSIRSAARSSSVRSPTRTSTSSKPRSGRNRTTRENAESESYTGYAPGIEESSGEWPIREQSKREQSHNRVISPPPSKSYDVNDDDPSPRPRDKNFIKDFDAYHF